MQDLINEDEFLPKEYNPRGWFARYYVIAIVISIIMLILFKLIHLENITAIILSAIITGIIIPLSLSLAMVCTKKEILLDTPKSRLVSGIFILQLCYLTPRLFNLLYTYVMIYFSEGMPEVFMPLLSPFALLIITYLITLALVIPIVNRARKIKQSLTQ